MKKYLFIAVALCCMVAATAQTKQIDRRHPLREKATKVEQLNRQTQRYSLKLDSIVFNEGSQTIIFNYNPDYQFSTVVTLFYGAWLSTMTYEYDAQNRLIRVSDNEPGSEYKIEYAYNNQDWISEAVYYERNPDWVPETKTLYEYDNNGQVLKITNLLYNNEDGIWVNNTYDDYHYSNGKLDEIVEYYWESGYSTWAQYTKDVYSYNNAGDCVEIDYYYDLSLYGTSSGLICYYKTIYEYDSNHNCVKQMEYDIDSDTGEEDLEDVIEFTYDLSVPSSVIAGLANFLGSSDLSVNNKLVSVLETSYSQNGTHRYLSELYYTDCSGIAENPAHTLTLSPNPVSEVLSLEASDLSLVEIFSMDGRMVMRLEKGFETLNVSGLAKGSYLLKATMSDGSVATQKFLKE